MDITRTIKKIASELSSHEISTPGSNYCEGDIYSMYIKALLSNPALAELGSVRLEVIVNFIVTVIEELDLAPYGHVPYIATLLSNPCLATVREG